MGNEQSSDGKSDKNIKNERSSDDEKDNTAIEQSTASLGIGAALITISVANPSLGGTLSTACLGTGIGMKVVEAGETIQLGAEIGGVGNQAVKIFKKE
ncbi:1194_t:CDS:2 [Rhizophagus irregularis]|nr:1194_t:CDS:2 [Rhizophagus irregularis]